MVAQAKVSVPAPKARRSPLQALVDAMVNEPNVYIRSRLGVAVVAVAAFDQAGAIITLADLINKG